MELNFAPTEVASYDFELPITINRTTTFSDQIETMNRYNFSQINSSSVTPYQSDTLGLSALRDKTPINRKSSRASTALIQKSLRRKVTAVALRHALQLSTSIINFRIPIKYFENLKDGGFYEAKVLLGLYLFLAWKKIILFHFLKSTLLTNKSHRSVKWCFDLRRSNKVLEDGIFKVCDGSMVPFVNSDKKSYGPEGEILPNESYELKILFCPSKLAYSRIHLWKIANLNL